ncbi:MAG: tetratricopeptide repeat protein, partial [Pseudomonadota bacterium]
EDALQATEEAVAIRRKLAQDRPDAFLPDLARALNNLSVDLSNLGRREDALQATEEAVAIRRKLAHDRPDAFLPELSVSLSVLADCLEASGRTKEALNPSREAIVALAPAFLRHPQAEAGRMAQWCQEYVERCEKLEMTPDQELLGPIIKVFEGLQSSGENNPPI